MFHATAYLCVPVTCFCNSCAIEELSRHPQGSFTSLAYWHVYTLFQRHMCENKQEVDFVCQRHASCRDYTDVYDTCGVLDAKVDSNNRVILVALCRLQTQHLYALLYFCFWNNLLV